MSADLVYPYRRSPVRLALIVTLLGLISIYYLKHAESDQHGESIAAMIRRNSGEAAVFNYLAAVFLIGFVAFEIYRFVVSYTRRTEIALEPSCIRLPARLARREIIIAYADIQSVLHQKLRSGEYLTVTPRAGKRTVIASSMLPSKDAFAQLRAELSARAKSAQAQ